MRFSLLSELPFLLLCSAELASMAQSSWYCFSCDRNSVPYILLILKVSRLTLNCHCSSNCSSVFVFFLPLGLGCFLCHGLLLELKSV
jgi:hypothetical protein